MAAVIKFLVVGLGVFASMVAGAALVLTQATELLPTSLAGDTAAVVEQVKTDSESVFAEIQKNIDMVADLKAKVQEAQLSGETVSLDAIISDITAVTESYERLASQRDDIRRGLLGKVAAVEGMRAAVDAEIQNLRQKSAGYSEQLALVSGDDPEIVRIRKAALSKAIGFLDGQIQLWQQFSAVEKDISLEMTDIQRAIDSFLSMVESTAIVYREGLNLLVLERNLNEAVALFSNDIPTMERLTTAMEDSWSNLDSLLSMLTGVAIGK